MPPIARTATIRLLIVDGRPLVRWALPHIAAEAPDLHTVGEASNSAVAVNLARAMEADVVTTDCSVLTEPAGNSRARCAGATLTSATLLTLVRL